MNAIYAHHDLQEGNKKRYGTYGCKKLLESPQYGHTSQLARDLLQCLHDVTNEEILTAKGIFEQVLDNLEEMPYPGPEFFDMDDQVDEATLKRYSEEMLAWLPDVRNKESEVDGVAELHRGMSGASKAIAQLTMRIDKLQGLQKLGVHPVIKQAKETELQLTLVYVFPIMLVFIDQYLLKFQLQDNILSLQEQSKRDAEDVHTLTTRVQKLLDSQSPPPLTLNPGLQEQIDAAANHVVQQIVHPSLLSKQTAILLGLGRQQEENWKQAWNYLQPPLTLVESIHIWLEDNCKDS